VAGIYLPHKTASERVATALTMKLEGRKGDGLKRDT